VAQGAWNEKKDGLFFFPWLSRTAPSTFDALTTSFRTSGLAFLPNNKGFYRKLQKHGSV